MRTKTESPRHSELHRGKELELSEEQGMPLEPGNRDDEQMAVRQADASGGETSTLAKEDQRQQVKTNLTS